jgi:hypothetical protein
MSVPSTALFAAGDLVSVARYDQYDPPWKRLGDPCRVVCVHDAGKWHCESGVMVDIESQDGRQMRLDSHWLKPYQANARNQGLAPQEKTNAK